MYIIEKMKNVGSVGYVSGKVSGIADLNAPKSKACQDKYVALGFRMIDPHTLVDNSEGEAEWASAIKACVEALVVRVDFVVVLDDWKDSRGAVIEVLMADAVGIPIFDDATGNQLEVRNSLYDLYMKHYPINIQVEHVVNKLGVKETE